MFSSARRGFLRAVKLLRNLFVSGRPIHSGIAGFATGITIAFLPSATWSTILAAACAMSCVTMAGFIVNDVCDRPKDILACVQRPIAMGLISSAEGVVGSSLLFTMAFCVTPLLGRSVLILFFTAGAVVAYSTFARRFPILKGVYTALLCCAPLAYGAAIGGGEFAITVYAALICFICGREIYLDVRDVAGDSRFGLQTIPVLIGILAAKRMAIGLMIAGGLFTLIVVRSTTGYVAAASSLLLLGAVLTWPGIELHRRLELTRIPIFLGAIALASTVWIG